MATSGATKEQSKEKVKEPKRYNVIMFNDDFTTMDFVVSILIDIFHMNRMNARGSRSDIDNYIGDKREKNEECGAEDNIKELLDKCDEMDTKLKDILVGDLERYAQLVSQDIERVKMDLELISHCVDENMRNIDD